MTNTNTNTAKFSLGQKVRPVGSIIEAHITENLKHLEICGQPVYKLSNNKIYHEDELETLNDVAIKKGNNKKFILESLNFQHLTSYLPVKERLLELEKIKIEGCYITSDIVLTLDMYIAQLRAIILANGFTNDDINNPDSFH